MRNVDTDNSFHSEIMRIFADPFKFGADHLLGIWCSYLKQDDSKNSGFPLSVTGTLAFTENVIGPAGEEYRVLLDGAIKALERTISFKHNIMEPLLISAIEYYFRSSGKILTISCTNTVLR
jgi:hypothetical protein